MEIKELLEQKNCLIIEEEFLTKKDVLKYLANLSFQQKNISNKKIVFENLLKREEQGTTGFGDEIAIPHARIAGLKKAQLIVLKLKNNIDWESLDQKPVNLIFSILVPEENQNDLHLEVLGTIASKILDRDFISQLQSINSSAKLYDYLIQSLNKTETISPVEKNLNQDFYVAVVACTFGLAHTYLAEEKLKQYAAENQLEIKVETHGAKGDLNLITEEDLLRAKGVILAVDKDLDLKHIIHQNILKIKTSNVMKDVDQVFKKINNPERKENKFTQFFKLKLFNGLNNSSAKVFNLFLIPVLIVGIFKYILTFQQVDFINEFFTGFEYIAVLAPAILTGILTYQLTKKNEVIAGGVFVVLAICSEINLVVNKEKSMGLLGVIVFTAISYLIYKSFYFIKDKWKFIYQNDNLNAGFKWLTKIIIIMSILTIAYFSINSLGQLNNNFYEFIFEQQANHWWFRFIIALIFFYGMMWDLGGPINKWILMISGFFFYDSLSVDVQQIWMTPITATALAIPMPSAAVWFRGIILNKYLDKEELIKSKEAKTAMLRSLSEGYLYFKNKYRWKAQIANFFLATTAALTVGYFNLEFYGGLANFYGIIFSFSTSTNLITYPNVVFTIFIVQTLLIGGLIQIIFLQNKNTKKKGTKNGSKKEMKNSLHSSDTLR